MSNPLDFHLMVDETMAMIHNHHGQDPFHHWTEENDEGEMGLDQGGMNEREREFLALIPAECGLLFRLKKAERTFRVHCFPTQDMRAEMREFILSQKKDMAFAGESHQGRMEDIHWFATEYFDLAQVIADHVGNKRFPLLSETWVPADPSAVWWMKDLGDSFKIYFNIPEIQWTPDLIPLGALGDGQVLVQRFQQMLPWLKKFFPVCEFVCHGNYLSLGTLDEGHEHFDIFKEMLLTGKEYGPFFENYLQDIDRTLLYFLKEIMGIRRFWLEAEELLTKKNFS